MRVALLTDIHANVQALDAVLADARSLGFDALWQMGDVVGYGPDPDAVIARLKELGASGVLGNHDAAAIGGLPLTDFNQLAASANRWTAGVLSDESKEYLAALPRVKREGDFTLVHGSLRDPLWEYLVTHDAARAHFSLQETTYSIVGHTHIPLVVEDAPGAAVGAESPAHDDVVRLAGRKLVINPGGVGQPRDGDPRACYALLDTVADSVTFRRVEYDVSATQKRMCDCGLPEPLILRLARGR
ncbi:MAG TPA: metallophosphoesterase family protein [Tepidiformaceae bacterium]